MKKRAMKKWIPKNTTKCGNCRWRHSLGKVKFHRNPPEESGWEKCIYSETCEEPECWKNENNNCQGEIWKCAYLDAFEKYTDSESTRRYKACNEHYPTDTR